MGENAGAVDIGERMQRGVVVARQEIVPGEHRKFPQLPVGEFRRNNATIHHRQCSRPVPFVVGDHRKVDFDHFGAERFEGTTRLFPEGDDRGTRRDGGCRAVILIDIHARHAEASTV